MRNYKRIAIVGALAAAGLVSAGRLRAFPNVTNWHDDASTSSHCGAGDIWGTGSVRDWGITCAHCHINNANQQGSITAQFTFSPQLSGGMYKPGTQYTVTVKLLGEHLGTSDPVDNKNGFTASFEDVNGKPMGTVLGDMQSSCPAPPTLPDPALPGTTFAFNIGSGCNFISSLGKNAMQIGQPSPTQWTFKWTAPAAGSGTAFMYYGMVDGDAGQTSLGDDVKVGKQMIAEGP